MCCSWPAGTAIPFFWAGPPLFAEVVDFSPKNLTVKAGDTVTWVSAGFHTVTFIGEGSYRPFYVPMEQPDGTIEVGVAGESVRLIDEFDETGYYNSGLIGPGVRRFGTRQEGIGFSLTFEKPGTYFYICPIHVAVGMTGVIRVEQRQ